MTRGASTSPRTAQDRSGGFQPDGAICALVRGLGFPSAVAVGLGDGPFPASKLYIVTFGGDVIEIPNVL